MAEFERPTTKEEFDQNFAPIKPRMNANQAYYESSRCLFCYDAPCIKSCPTGIDIPLFIRQINNGNTAGAAKTIYDSNWFGNACGQVCPTEVLCEGSCVYNEQEVNVIEIGRLQDFATSHVIENDIKLYQLAASLNKRIAIVGAGPAGISCACELRMMGYEVDIFEAKQQPSGLTVHGVAPYKISNEDALAEMEYLQNQFGFSVHYNRRLSGSEIAQLKDDYDALFLGVGLGSTRKIGIPGEELPQCFGATEYIEQLRKEQHNESSIGKKVVVIGGGNTAMDAASESARMGAEKVILAYRGNQEDMSAYDFEYDLAKSVGVEGMFNSTPIAIGGGDKVQSILMDCGGEQRQIECDTVIFATGQEKRKDLFAKAGLDIDEGGKLLVNELFQTSAETVFAGGDAVNGGAEVVDAAAHGKAAAQGIHLILSGKESND